MNDSRRPFNAPQPQEIDDTEDRMGSVKPLDFSDEDELVGDIDDRRIREAGMTEASTPDHHPTDDDLDAETLILEDGGRSADEEGEDLPADLDLSIVDADEIGGGSGYDEAELARRDPLDGKPYNR